MNQLYLDFYLSKKIITLKFLYGLVISHEKKKHLATLQNGISLACGMLNVFMYGIS